MDKIVYFCGSNSNMPNTGFNCQLGHTQKEAYFKNKFDQVSQVQKRLFTCVDTFVMTFCNLSDLSINKKDTWKKIR